MLVRAADGLRVPMEHAPRSYITTKPREVPASVYYQRRLATGELVTVTPDSKLPAPPASGTPDKKTPSATHKGRKA